MIRESSNAGYLIVLFFFLSYFVFASFFFFDLFAVFFFGLLAVMMLITVLQIKSQACYYSLLLSFLSFISAKRQNRHRCSVSVIIITITFL